MTHCPSGTIHCRLKFVHRSISQDSLPGIESVFGYHDFYPRICSRQDSRRRQYSTRHVHNFGILRTSIGSWNINYIPLQCKPSSRIYSTRNESGRKYSSRSECTRYNILYGKNPEIKQRNQRNTGCLCHSPITKRDQKSTKAYVRMQCISNVPLQCEASSTISPYKTVPPHLIRLYHSHSHVYRMNHENESTTINIDNDEACHSEDGKMHSKPDKNNPVSDIVAKTKKTALKMTQEELDVSSLSSGHNTYETSAPSQQTSPIFRSQGESKDNLTPSNNSTILPTSSSQLTQEEMQSIANVDLNYNVMSLDNLYLREQSDFISSEKEDFLPNIQRDFIPARTKHPVDNFNLFSDEDTLDLMSERYSYPLRNSPYFEKSRNAFQSSIQYHCYEEATEENIEVLAARYGYIWQIPWNRSIRLMRLTLRRIEMLNDEEKERIRSEWRSSFSQSVSGGFHQKKVEVAIQNGIRIANYYLKKYAKSKFTDKEIEEAMIKEMDLPPPPVKPAESSSDESVPHYNELLI